jgi:hypothetical protein
MSDPVPKTTADALLAAGYREYPPTRIDTSKRLFQKRVDDDRGTLYFVNFHEWDHPDGSVRYDAQLACETSTNGYAWVTVQESGIRETELRIAQIWAAAGSVYYEGGDRETKEAIVKPETTDDEFRGGIWWIPDGAGTLRNATPRECAAEIKRARAAVSRLTVRVDELKSELVEYEYGRR